MMWSPYEIDIVLHHHTSHAEYPRRDAPAYPETISRLIECGVLGRDHAGFLSTTGVGQALVSMWCNQPLPVALYVDPRFSGDSNG